MALKENHFPLEAGDVLAELKKGICTGFGSIIESDATNADIQPIFGAVASDDVSVSTTREAFRILSAKVAVLLKIFLEEFKKGSKLRNDCIEFIPVITSVLSEKKVIEFNNGKQCAGGSTATSFIQQIASSPVHPDNILSIIVAFREVNVTLPSQVYESMFKRMEDVPRKDIPATLYQVLLWCRNSPTLTGCFEMTFALLETQCDHVGECLSHIKLALNHESLIFTAFVKYANTALRSSMNPSPVLLVLLLGALLEKRVLAFLVNLVVSRRRLEHLGSIPGIDVARWPRLERILERLVDIVDLDDEPSILGLIRLGNDLAAYKHTDKAILQIIRQSAIKYLKFEASLRVMIKTIIEEMSLFGESCIPQPSLECSASVLGELSTINGGKLLCEIIRERPEYTNSFIQSLGKTGESQALILPMLNEVELVHFANTSPALFIRISLKWNVYTELLQMVKTHAVSIPSIFTLAFVQLWSGENMTDWAGMLNKCIDEHGRVTEFLPVLLQILLQSSKGSTTEEAILCIGAMNNLSETLCHNIAWFPTEIPVLHQSNLRPIVTGLYDFGLLYCLDCDDLESGMKIEAMAKIVAQRERFTIQFTNPVSELIILDCAGRLAQLYLSMKTHSQLELLLSHLCQIPWSASQDVDDVVKVLIFLGGPDCKFPNPFVCKENALCSTQVSEVGTLLLNFSGKELPAKDLCILVELLLEACSGIDAFSDVAFNNSILQVCRTWTPYSDSDAKLAKLLAELVVSYPRNVTGTNMKIICKDVLLAIGRLDTDSAETPKGPALQAKLKMITSRSADHVVNAIWKVIKSRLEECKWLTEITATICQTSSIQGSSSLNGICDDLSWMSEACVILTEAALCGSSYSRLMDALQSLFKMATRKLPLSDSFTLMVAHISGDLTRNIYIMLPIVQQNELELYRELSEHKKKTNNLTRRFRNSIAKETRLVPGLIFHIEAFERSVLALGKLHRTTIVKSFHRSTARDFRIQLDELETALEQVDASDSDVTSEPAEMTLEVGTDL
ncbi:hypothetical protein PSACC_02942 [Paramicrosporidium saccamoebae]|uniref:Uncharacterized protein n=1 Tax=Paramicrosporidium saccamoebae TaxID=1246581 RepID=A0A2H9THL5_9FUNG|nr:hypothetical protein PSACC_02942 [Paramicrosporidium saccamoebae]